MNALRYIFSPKMLVPAIAVALIGALGFAIGTQSPALAASGNDVVYGGYSNPTDLANKVANNTELKILYGHHFTPNWQMGDLNNWKANAKHATLHKDGRLVLDNGDVIATDTKSLGREQFDGQRNVIKIANKTYYYSNVKDVLQVNTTGAYVLVNPDDHSMQFAAMTQCANPIWGKSPGYKCDSLKQTKVNDTTYKYVATPYTKDGATVSKIVYDFGDGKNQTVTSNFGQEVTHTYAPGKFTARATVYFSVNGKEKSDTRQSCTKPVEVPQPPKPTFVCTGLVAKQVAGSRTKFTFTATAQVKDATLKSGTFKFDDGKTAPATAVGNTVTTTYEYAKEGEHTTTVDLTFDKGNDNGNKNCKVVTKTVPETCKDTPEKPECQPPKTCEDTPNAPECQPKTCADTPEAPECQPKKDCTTNPEMDACKVIPSTGPAEIIGSVLGLGTLTGAGVYYRTSRRNLLDAIKN